MDRRILADTLTDMNIFGQFPARKPPTPDSINHFMLRKGHMIEYIKLGAEQKRLIVFFWEAPECVIPIDNYYSILEPLDETEKMTTTYGTMIMALRRFPLFADIYRMERLKYYEKIEARMYALAHLGPKERLAKLKKEQPWVFDLVREEDIASYLRLNVGILRRLKER